MELYKQHVIDQALTLLKAHESSASSPRRSCSKPVREDLTKKAGIKGVFCGGTEMTPQFHRFAVEELLDGVYFAPTYGNTLMGLAVHKPRRRQTTTRSFISALSARDDRSRDSDDPRNSSGTARPAACVSLR